ncbi:unnamed protein product [Parascedosporium putredinis]|uniref:lytic cellulose monooxygenase (C4-dehydrogenating) n=1 Tax=Parascedosporium putredinis TaxID=1442378 RepID=A0A9P1M8E9_9PEZI|nr:unnamed protein product [Parascedosporium putredinis]CAI7993459.1 unnamed protein product [Parascedosporium putredinis]
MSLFSGNVGRGTDEMIVPTAPTRYPYKQVSKPQPLFTMSLKAATFLSLAALASAHGHVAKIVAGGVEYPGAVPGNVPADSPAGRPRTSTTASSSPTASPTRTSSATRLLSFAKIAEAGLVSGSNPGTWASDELMANGNAWTVTIPSSVAPGHYVLRHEIIALHGAGSANGAQAPSGQAATAFYTATDPGILFNLYQDFSSYPIPGPSVWRG